MFPTLCEEILHHLWEYYFRNLPKEFHLTWHVMHWPQPRQCLPLQIAAKSEYTTVKTLHTEICDLQKPHNASAGINPFFNCKCRVSVSISHWIEWCEWRYINWAETTGPNPLLYLVSNIPLCTIAVVKARDVHQDHILGKSGIGYRNCNLLNNRKQVQTGFTWHDIIL